MLNDPECGFWVRISLSMFIISAVSNYQKLPVPPAIKTHRKPDFYPRLSERPSTFPDRADRQPGCAAASIFWLQSSFNL
jgi:hypothetical protein